MDAFDDEKMKIAEEHLRSLSPRKASFFLIPGADRDPETWNLKPDCRSMRLRPGKNPAASKEFFMEFLSKFAWFDQVVFMKPASHYREYIVFGKDFSNPVFVRDDGLFEETCTVDAEKML